MSRVPTALLLLAVGACSDSASLHGASDGTPVRYILCHHLPVTTESDAGCFVAARFKTMDGCESHKRWSGMLCVYEPARMTCKEDDKPIGSAYCTM